MCQPKYKCGNCNSISKTYSNKCTTCGMKGMLVELQPIKIKTKPAIKKIFSVCQNCGTTEMGNGSTCKVCRFPIAQEKQIISKTTHAKEKVS